MPDPIKLCHPLDSATITVSGAAFAAFGTGGAPTTKISAVLLDAGLHVPPANSRKIALRHPPLWVFFFEDVPLDKDYILLILEAKPKGKVLDQAGFHLDGVKGITVSYPPSGGKLCLNNPVSYGTTDRDSPISGVLDPDGTPINGNTTYQTAPSPPSNIGNWCVQFPNTVTAGGHTFQVSNTVGDQQKYGITVGTCP